MRQINWKFAGILALALVVVAGGGNLLHIAQTGRAAAVRSERRTPRAYPRKTASGMNA